MARITRVQRAQQRYEMVPVLDAEGHPVKITLTRKDGSPQLTKSGRPVEITRTVQDRTRPLPMPTCGKCGTEIKVGAPYKHISPRSGPYGGTTLIRCDSCPDWHMWEYSSSLSARIAEIQFNFHESVDVDAATSADDIRSCLEDAASAIRELAEEKRESAQSLEDGFGHETYQSSDLNEQADSLDAWADDVEGADVPDYPEHDCELWSEEYGGCGDDCQHDDTDITGAQADEWRSEVYDIISIMDDSPC